MLKPFEVRMLSGKPFNTEDIKREFGTDNDVLRLIERTVHKLHRKGLLKYERRDLQLPWVATDAGRRKLELESGES
jgi:hypothetical protein